MSGRIQGLAEVSKALKSLGGNMKEVSEHFNSQASEVLKAQLTAKEIMDNLHDAFRRDDE